MSFRKHQVQPPLQTHAPANAVTLGHFHIAGLSHPTPRSVTQEPRETTAHSLYTGGGGGHEVTDAVCRIEDGPHSIDHNRVGWWWDSVAPEIDQEHIAYGNHVRRFMIIIHNEVSKAMDEFPPNDRVVLWLDVLKAEINTRKFGLIELPLRRDSGTQRNYASAIARNTLNVLFEPTEGHTFSADVRSAFGNLAIAFAKYPLVDKLYSWHEVMQGFIVDLKARTITTNKHAHMPSEQLPQSTEILQTYNSATSPCRCASRWRTW